MASNTSVVGEKGMASNTSVVAEERDGIQYISSGRGKVWHPIHQ